MAYYFWLCPQHVTEYKDEGWTMRPVELHPDSKFRGICDACADFTKTEIVLERRKNPPTTHNCQQFVVMPYREYRAKTGRPIMEIDTYLTKIDAVIGIETPKGSRLIDREKVQRMVAHEKDKDPSRDVEQFKRYLCDAFDDRGDGTMPTTAVLIIDYAVWLWREDNWNYMLGKPTEPSIA